MHTVSDSAARSAIPQQAANGRTRAIGVLAHKPAVAVLAAIVLLAPSVVWIFRDAHVWPWDQAYYATLALQIRDALRDGVPAWLSAFLTVPGARAPLLPWFAQATLPLTRVLGEPERALLFANVVTGGITLGLVYSAARRLGGTPAIALTAMLACAGTSDFIAFNHQFLTEAGQAMALAGLAWAALRADDAAWPRLVAATLFWTTLAMLAKTTSIAFVLPFLLYIAIVCSASRRQRFAARPVDFSLLFVSLVLAAITVIWYAIHWSAIVTHIAEATTDKDIVLAYGSERPLVVKLQFWSRALLQALSPFSWLSGIVVIVMAWALGTGAVRVWRGRLANLPHRAIESHFLFALCLAGTIMAGLITYSRMINEDVRFLAPMLCLVVLLLAWSLVTLHSRWITAAIALLLAGNWSFTHATVQGFVARPERALPYLQAPQNNSAAMARMARAVRDVCDKSRAGRLNIIGAELADFNVPSADFYAEKMRRAVGYRCDYGSLGYLEGDPQRAIRRLYELNADFFVTLPLDELPRPGTDPLDRISRPVAEWIAASPDFQRVTPDGDSLAIYRRRR